MLNIPTAPVGPFEWTLFASRFAMSSRGAAEKGYTSQPVEWEYNIGWDSYVEQHERFSKAIIPKESAPGIIHGDCGGWHGNEDVRTTTALVIDCDRSPLPENEIDSFLATLGDIRYLFQWRNNKFHLVLPLAARMETPPLDVMHVQLRREAAIKWFGDQWGRQLDRTPAVANALLHPYSKRTEDERVLTRASRAPKALDLDTLLGRLGYQDRAVSRRVVGTNPQLEETGNVVLKCLDDAGLLLDVSGEKAAIRCPFHPEETHGPTSTVVYPKTVTFKCLHDRCKYRMKVEFLKAIPGMLEAVGRVTPEFRMELDAATPTVSVVEAREKILGALSAAKPFQRTATVVRVTTGAGKTRAVAEYLSAYCAPADEESVGRSAFLATPTNALLREVSERLTIEHRTVTGVLAVLNDTGGPACLKFERAKALQEAGGDVHRLMCAQCEHRETCPARLGARRGQGTLTLTNHSMLPSLVREAQESGRVPLVVWDESPPFVEMVRVTGEDLDWYIRRFDEEDSSRGVTLDRLSKVTLFAERYRVAWRPLIEVMRRLGAHPSLGDAVAEYGATRLSDSHLQRAESLLSLSSSSDVWTRIRSAALGARRVNVSEQMFDALSEESQGEVLRASAVQRFLETLVECGDDANLVRQPGAYELSQVTEHGALWKAFGGVILDATAPVHDLLALRPDAVVVDIAVEDRGTTVRRMVHVPNASRTRLATVGAQRRIEILGEVTGHLNRQLREIRRTLGREPRTLLVTYKALLEELKEYPLEGTVEFAHYGNTRGYDGWFQRGFDVFVTLGDPYANLESERQAYSLLGVTTDFDEYCAYRARAECAQAHGRARSPQAKLADGARLNIHYGRLAPLGWHKDNAMLEDI